MFLMMMQPVSNYQNGVLSHQKEQFWNQHIRVSCTKRMRPYRCAVDATLTRELH